MIDWNPWEDKRADMALTLQEAKNQLVQDQIEFFATPKGIKAKSLGRSFFSALPEEVEPIIASYIINGDPHPLYERSEIYDSVGDCTIITHGVLDQYLGKYFSETAAAKEFLLPNIEIESAALVRFHSKDSFYEPDGLPGYVVEHVYKGEMHVLYDNTPDYMRLGMYRPLLAHGYRPTVDPPRKKLVYKGLELIVFTYKEGDA